MESPRSWDEPGTETVLQCRRDHPSFILVHVKHGGNTGETRGKNTSAVITFIMPSQKISLHRKCLKLST